MSRAGQWLVLLFAAGALVLNFPVLAIFNRAAGVAGIPLLYVYLFGAWAVGVVAVYFVVRAGIEDED